MKIQSDPVVDANSFMAFLREFMELSKTNPAEWNNVCLYSFLDGMHGYLAENGYDQNSKKLSWEFISELMKGGATFV
jgi:hypothetical protein